MPRRVPSARPPAASSGPAGLHPWRSDPRPSLCLRTSGPVPECRALTGSQVGGGACRAPGRRVLTEGMPGEAGLLLPAPCIPTRTPSPPSAAGSLWPVMFPTSLAFSSVQRSAPSEGAGDTGLTVTVTARLATSSKPAWSPTFSELRQRRSTGWEEGPRPGHTGPRSAALGLRPPPLPPAVGRPTPVPPPCWCWGRMGSRRKGIPGGGVSRGRGAPSPSWLRARSPSLLTSLQLLALPLKPAHRMAKKASPNRNGTPSLLAALHPALTYFPSLPAPGLEVGGPDPGCPLECKPGLLGVTQMSLVLSSP